MKSVLFYWSKGAESRRRIILLMLKCEQKNQPCFVSALSRKLKLSHVAILRHLDLMEEDGYVEVLNPGGKPAFLALTETGKTVANEFS